MRNMWDHRMRFSAKSFGSNLLTPGPGPFVFNKENMVSNLLRQLPTV